MRDGYYLSSYISVDKIGNLYKLLSNRHDMNIALWKKNGDDIELVRYWELERLSRLKHHDLPFYDSDSADGVIKYLLEKEGISIDDVECIWGSPNYNRSKQCVKLQDYYCHSIAHLFSSLLMDTDIFYKENIIGLALDLRADNETESRNKSKEYVGCVSCKGKVEYFNIASPAVFWYVFKKEIGLEEGSLMALANATRCEKKNKIELDRRMMQYVLDYDYGYDFYHRVFDDLSEDNVINFDERFTLEDNLISAAIKEVNRVSMYVMEIQLNKIIKKYNLDPKETYLAISGGYGLNCPNNSKIMRKYGFKGFLGVPCMNDAGESLGMGLFMFYSNMKKFRFKLNHAFYGNSYDESNILELLQEKGFIDSITELDENIFVKDITNNVIIWFDGEAEIGPRALGHRSLLGDPRKIEIKNELNRIKKRQFWRPVAPIVLEEYVDEWFEDMFISPYMLHTSMVLKNKKDLVPAIVHLDGSSRLQTLNENSDNNIKLYKMIKAFYKKTGVPIICNTSLNDRGEPICNRPCEALHFALKKGIKIVYVNGKRVELKNFNNYAGESQFEAEIKMELSEDDKSLAMKNENPYNLKKEELMWREFFSEFDYKTQIGAENLKRAVKMVRKHNPVMDKLFDEKYL